MKKIAILTPAYDGLIRVENAHSVTAAMFHLVEAGHQVDWFYCGNIASTTKARNALVSRALFHGAEELVFIDADIQFEPQALERLLSHEQRIVGGVQRAREGDSVHAYAVRPIDGKLKVSTDGLAEVAGVSTAFLRVHRNVYEDFLELGIAPIYHDENIDGSDDDLLAAYFDYAVTSHPVDPGKSFYWGEDYNFCNLARAAGWHVYADLAIELGHIKPIRLGGPALGALRAGEATA